ncbi:MAG: hypothetical protein ISR65_13665 [Bacteriovoracaceae bacterium]|nr:hypothetical protein [Bacteriovoracaceae bacterium]
MLSRKEHKEKAIWIPHKWTDELVSLLLSVYKKQCNLAGQEFNIFGFTYPTEILVVASLIVKDDQSRCPVSYFVSTDLTEIDKSKELLDKLVDLVGMFFDSYFVDQNWDGYCDQWTKYDYKKTLFYYKVTRENVRLTLEANKLLGVDI